MSKDGRKDLPTGITRKMRKKGTRTVPVFTKDGTPVYRVRVWDPVTKRQIERTAEGLEAAKALLGEFNEAKRRPGRLKAERVRFIDVAARYIVAYKIKRDSTPGLRLGGAWMFIDGANKSRAIAIVQSSSSRGGAGRCAMRVPAFGRKFWMMISWMCP